MGYYPQTPNDECLLDNFREPKTIELIDLKNNLK